MTLGTASPRGFYVRMFKPASLRTNLEAMTAGLVYVASLLSESFVVLYKTINEP